MDIHVLHGDREFLTSDFLEGLSEYRNDFRLSTSDKEIVVL